MAVFAMFGDPKDSARPRARESDSGRCALILELTFMTRLSPLLAKTPRWLSGAGMCPDPCPPHSLLFRSLSSFCSRIHQRAWRQGNKHFLFVECACKRGEMLETVARSTSHHQQNSIHVRQISYCACAHKSRMFCHLAPTSLLDHVIRVTM